MYNKRRYEEYAVNKHTAGADEQQGDDLSRYPQCCWLQTTEGSSGSRPSCVGAMFYKLIILLSGSSTVLLCSLHATLHLRYTHISPVYNRARSSTFVIWWCCAVSLPAAGLSLTHRWWGFLVCELQSMCTCHTLVHMDTFTKKHLNSFLSFLYIFIKWKPKTVFDIDCMQKSNGVK